MQTISFKNVFPLILFILLLSLLFNQFYLTGNVTFGDFFKVKSTFSNEVTAMNKELVALNKQYLSKNSFSEKNTSFKSLEQLALKRKALMLDLAKENPSEFLASVMSEKDRKKLPLEIQKEIEVRKSLDSASLTVFIFDLENSSSDTSYFLEKDSNIYSFYPFFDINLLSNSLVSTSGYLLDTTFVANTFDNTQFKVISSEVPSALGEQRILVIPIRFNDTSNIPFTVQELEIAIFNNSPFQKFYSEQSYDQVSFSGEVLEWYQVNRSKNYVNLFNFQESDVYDVLNIYEDYIFENDYSRILFVVDSFIGGGGYSSKGSRIITFEDNRSKNLSTSVILAPSSSDIFLTSSSSEFHWNWFYNILSHEIGHALGLFHAFYLDCPINETFSSNCKSIEYGNIYDTMGSGSAQSGLHFNGFYKEDLQWISSKDVLIINTSGNYTLSRFESAPQFAKIISSHTPYSFGIEYRKPFGYDLGLLNSSVFPNSEGIFIYLQNGFPINKPISNPYLLDLNSNYSLGFWRQDALHSALSLNQTFYDSNMEVRIGPITSLNSSSVTFSVDFEPQGCLNYSLLLLDIPEQVYQYVNESTYIQIFVSNLMSSRCNNYQELYLEPSLPLGWNFSLYDPYLNKLSLPVRVDASYSTHFFILIEPPLSAPFGTYKIPLNVYGISKGVKPSSANFSFTRNLTFDYLPTLHVSNYFPTSVIPGKNVFFEGAGFSESLEVELIQEKTFEKLSDIPLYSTSSFSNSFFFQVPLTFPNGDRSIPTPLGNYTILVSSSDKSLSFNLSVISSCSLVPVTGPCKAAFTKYYYDTSSNSCKSFIWGGCGVFPFDTLDTCTAQCVNTSQSPVKVNPPVVANTSVCYWSPDPRVRADPSQARSYVSQNLYGYPGSTDSRLLCDQGTWYVTVDEWSYFKFDASRPWGYKLVSEGTRIGNWTIQNARWVLTKTIEQPSIPKPLLKSCVWPPEPNAAVIGHANSSELLYLSGIAAPYTDARVLCYDGFWYTPVNEWPYFVYENRQTGFVDTPKASWGIRVVKPTETLGGFRVVNDSFWKLRWVK